MFKFQRKQFWNLNLRYHNLILLPAESVRRRFQWYLKRPYLPCLYQKMNNRKHCSSSNKPIAIISAESMINIVSQNSTRKVRPPLHNKNKSFPPRKQKAEQRIRFIYLSNNKTQSNNDRNMFQFHKLAPRLRLHRTWRPFHRYISNEMKRNARLLPTAFIYKQSSYFKGPSPAAPCSRPWFVHYSTAKWFWRDSHPSTRKWKPFYYFWRNFFASRREQIKIRPLTR